MMKGLLVDTYRTPGGDCTNGGASSKHDVFVLSGTNPHTKLPIAEIFEPNSAAPEMVLVEGPYQSLRAVPKELQEANVWVMFGGNFIYSCDARFPTGLPIKIFDRVEGGS